MFGAVMISFSSFGQTRDNKSPMPAESTVNNSSINSNITGRDTIPNQNNSGLTPGINPNTPEITPNSPPGLTPNTPNPSNTSPMMPTPVTPTVPVNPNSPVIPNTPSTPNSPKSN
jgi:hypothetical protein